MTKYTMERPRQVWVDDGERYEVGLDRDGLGLVELRTYDEKGKLVRSLSLPKPVWDELKMYEHVPYHDYKELEEDGVEGT